MTLRKTWPGKGQSDGAALVRVEEREGWSMGNLKTLSLSGQLEGWEGPACLPATDVTWPLGVIPEAWVRKEAEEEVLSPLATD